MNSAKRLVILDLDNTLFDALRRWEACLGTLVEEFSRVNNVHIGIVEDLVREAHGQHRFNDGAALVDAIIEADPQLHVFAGTQENKKLQENWLSKSIDFTTFYDGTLEALKTWHSAGVRCVIETDCEDVAVIRNLWCLGENAGKKGDLESAEGILDYFDKIYCQPGIAESECFLDAVGEKFQKKIKTKMHRWDDRHYKPSADHMTQILFESGTPAEEAVYIGDSYKDGAEAATVSPSVDFIWAAYGADVGQPVLDLYSRVGSKSFTYGLEAIRKAMQEREVVPTHILHADLSEVLGCYQWESARETQKYHMNHPQGQYARTPS